MNRPKRIAVWLTPEQIEHLNHAFGILSSDYTGMDEQDAIDQMSDSIMDAIHTAEAKAELRAERAAALKARKQQQRKMVEDFNEVMRERLARMKAKKEEA